MIIFFPVGGNPVNYINFFIFEGFSWWKSVTIAKILFTCLVFLCAIAMYRCVQYTVASYRPAIGKTKQADEPMTHGIRPLD